MMSKAILYRNDDQDAYLRSALIYRHVECALRKLAQSEGRVIHADFNLHTMGSPRVGTVYTSAHSVVAIGLLAHESLSAVRRTSVVYLDPSRLRISEGADVARLIGCIGAGQPQSRVILLGKRAKRASVLLGSREICLRELPPLDLSPANRRRDRRPRITIVNQLEHDRIARTILIRFLNSGMYSIDAYGFVGPTHNSVRYLDDSEVSDDESSVHVHIGSPSERHERIRICDSWQSRVPVLYFSVDCEGSVIETAPDIHDNHNALICSSYSQACEFLTLILGTPNLYRQLAENGRASAAPAARAWDGLAKDLAA